jgi:hypothetical protein
MSGNEQFFGMVKNGEFYVFAPQQLEGTTVKLTRNMMEDSTNPESGIIDLKDFEGKIIEVSGYDGGKWLYSANVDEEAGPVLSNFLKKVFLKDEVRQKRCIMVIGLEKESFDLINKNIREDDLSEHFYKLVEKHVSHTAIYKIQIKSYIELPDDINELDPDFIISFQFNTNDQKTPNSEILYYQISEAGKKMAEILKEHITTDHNLLNINIKAHTKKDEFGLLFHNTTAPCVILKLSFMNNVKLLENLANTFAKAIDDISEKVNLEHRPIGSNVFI